MQMTAIPAEPDFSSGASLLSAIQGFSDQPQNLAVSLHPTLSSEAVGSNVPVAGVSLPNSLASEGQRTTDAAFRTMPTKLVAGLPESTEANSINQTEELFNPSEITSSLLNSPAETTDEDLTTRMGQQARQVSNRGGFTDPAGVTTVPH